MKQRFHSQSHPKLPFLHVHHPGSNLPAENGYFKLSRHFKWALDSVIFANGIMMDSIADADYQHPFMIRIAYAHAIGIQGQLDGSKNINQCKTSYYIRGRFGNCSRFL